MERTKFYSGMIPSLEDLEFEQDVKEKAVKERVSDFFTDGVLIGLQVTLETSGVYIQPGIAYVSGERIVVPEPTLVTDTVQDGFVFLKFVQEETEPESHFLTGELYNTRRLDSFEIQFEPLSNEINNAILLSEILNGNIIDMRSFIELKLSKPDFVDPPSDLTVTTGFESDLSLSSNLAF